MPPTTTTEAGATKRDGGRAMTRDEAIKALKPCGAGHWYTGGTCDSCWVNEHRCPPTLLREVPKQIKALERAIEIGKMAEECLAALKSLGLEPSR
jgi:hypothetical protein